MSIAFPKRAAYRNAKLLTAARGEACTMESDVCNGDRETTVFCHLNESFAGKAWGQKADDCAGFFGCAACHAAYDTGEIDDPWMVLRAYYRTLRRLLDKGVLR